jgi:hypothetical protein
MKTVLWTFLLSGAGFLLTGCASPPTDLDGGTEEPHEDDDPSDDEQPVEETPVDVPDDQLTWQRANLTTFESYPTSEEECVDFNGCQWAGHFAGVRGQQTLEWVQENNIAAVHSDDWGTYELKTLRLRNEWGSTIDVTVYDLCSDSDCDGCCTRNKSETGFLIDLEVHTAQRFGQDWGVVEWACVDC